MLLNKKHNGHNVVLPINQVYKSGVYLDFYDLLVPVAVVQFVK